MSPIEPQMGKYRLFIALWVLYCVSVILMVGDIILVNFNVYTLGFYALTNATLLYRLFGVCWCTVIFHGLIPVAVLLVMLFLHWFDDLKNFLVLSIVIPLAIQILLAIPLVLLRCRRDCNLQALLTGIHAHLGLLCMLSPEASYIGLLTMHCLYAHLSGNNTYTAPVRRYTTSIRKIYRKVQTKAES
uniref:Uncharacterized protein n=1 Tax=Glossina brevipalpis TaxID=37001 RepID=A0A1A9WUB6_9MUSC